MADAEPVMLRMEGICKRFPGVVANDGVNLDVRAGEVHALLGENGAGKTTLMSVLCGLYHPDAGSIIWKGHPVRFASPRQAAAVGIGMVHQDFKLIQRMTVAENMMLGRRSRGPFFDCAGLCGQWNGWRQISGCRWTHTRPCGSSRLGCSSGSPS